MHIYDIFVVLGAVFVLIIIFKYIGKLMVRLVSILAIIAFILYFLFYWHGGVLDLGNRDFMIVELQQKYCQGKQSDNVKCDCIISPVYEDIMSELSDEEIDALYSNKLGSLRVILKSLNENRDQIIDCLKENDSLEEWDEFIRELQNMDLKNELDEKLESLKSL